ncbi:TonB C-terminal domain-containing protein [Myxococcus sp. SDU36]|uniref:energy transducer TonB family protein n=1 Tax=Myxococcus sp. SDU36 TaxID=2831967 RepID=UPI002542E5C8|nr:TonB C-terminal domain-containing protein [Myxococcus sp. SDU36]WIG98959.1 TonB C-terminal domain-containing protein [Myxococcus sp. SDU36]
MSREPTRRLLPALVASLGVHGLLWLALEGGEPVTRPPPPDLPPALEWVDVEVAEAPPEPASPPRSTGTARLKRGPAPAHASAQSAHDTPVAPQADAQPERDAEVPDTAPASRHFEDAPLAGSPPTDIPRANAAPGSRLLLAARQVTALSGAHPGVAAELDGGGVDPHAPPSAQALVEELVSESVGRGRVERGLVHPYYGQLGKALMKAWDADRAVKEHGLQGYFDMGMERGRAYSRIWRERASDYGASGSFAAKNGPGEDRRRPLSTAGDPTLNTRRELRQQMRQEFRTTRRALIRVIQDTKGNLVDVHLLEPSHEPQVDKEALKDVRAMAEKLPPPPDEAVGGRSRLTSVWEFELLISISPPVPTFSFEFDEALGFIDARLPLDRRIYKRVRLVEVR